MLSLVHLLRDFELKYFLDEPGKLADGLVEEWKQLVCLQAEVLSQLINCFVLQAHASQCGCLDVRQLHGAFWEHQEVQLSQSGHKVHDQVEVDQVLCIALQSFQIKHGDVLLKQLSGNLACRGLLACLDRCETALFLAWVIPCHEEECKRGWQFAELESKQSNDASPEVSCVGIQP